MTKEYITIIINQKDYTVAQNTTNKKAIKALVAVTNSILNEENKKKKAYF